MNQNAPCPTCGKPLPADAPMGVCPNCLISAGFGTVAADATAEKLRAFDPPSPEELAAHFPQLEVLELLGCGGMGAVYKARQTELDRMVALKILPPAIGEEAGFAERFAREAKALAKLNHPGIVTIHDFGRADGLYYFLMEFVDGVNLRQLLHGDRIAPREALAIVPQICDALQFAHDHGIVHRDIKPENILLDRRGRVKVADFGIAKLTGANEQTGTATGTVSSAFTEAGKVIGTPSYMAPEQSSNPADVDHRADIYALGVVFYQMLTGELPGKQIEAPSKKVHVDVRLDEIVLRALEKKPEMRYQQVSLLKTQVETIAGTGGAQVAMGSFKESLSEAHSMIPARARETKMSAEAPPARFSRTAIVGACWAAFPFLALLLYMVARSEGGPGQTPTKLGFFLAITLLPLGFTAPLGTTILGWIAVSQIRRSAGRLYGLGLALFAAVLFPLLALDALIVWLAMGFNVSVPTAVLVSLLIDLYLIWKIWRSLHQVSFSGAHRVGWRQGHS